MKYLNTKDVHSDVERQVLMAERVSILTGGEKVGGSATLAPLDSPIL